MCRSSNVLRSPTTAWTTPLLGVCPLESLGQRVCPLCFRSSVHQHPAGVPQKQKDLMQVAPTCTARLPGQTQGQPQVHATAGGASCSSHYRQCSCSACTAESNQFQPANRKLAAAGIQITPPTKRESPPSPGFPDSQVTGKSHLSTLPQACAAQDVLNKPSCQPV